MLRTGEVPTNVGWQPKARLESDRRNRDGGGGEAAAGGGELRRSSDGDYQVVSVVRQQVGRGGTTFYKFLDFVWGLESD
jgi:hypothetical protein